MIARTAWLGWVLAFVWTGSMRADDPVPAPAPAAKAAPKTPPAAEAKAPEENTKTPQDKPSQPSLAETVEQLTKRVRPSVVVITFTGREGQQQGLGTGFVIDESGLIATNLHVLGEARPISVQLADGSRHEVIDIHASDRHFDLAIVRIKPPAARPLVALPLGDSAQVPDGTPVIALGNPLGLQHSVVSGVVSGTREVDGRRMIQLAIPIEPGNSGGPVVDFEGRVVGIVTMKSLVTKNLGFAVEVNSLKPLIEKPNPVPMSRWLTIGTIDPKEWTSLFGARWQQRSGRILVSGTGQGFGGRALCLAQRATPELPFELAVTVKLDDEAGAAGLVFHADGRDRHYGFYPSAGKLRLSRFEGPDVYSWRVLYDRPSPHYRPGDWNRLKVRVEKGKLSCYVNDELVIESTDDVFTSGQVGLAKFRDTEAEFKQFQVAPRIDDQRVPAEASAKLVEAIDRLPALSELKSTDTAALADETLGVRMLRERALQLEKRSAELRRVARDVHVRGVVTQLQRLVRDEDDDFDLLRGSLLIARLDDEELDVDAYVRQVDRMAIEIKQALAADAKPAARLAALRKYLFTENGFHGSRTDYYHRANSYLNRVIDDREGIPITLSVLYIELARRLDVPLVGVGLPGHFCVRWVNEGDAPESDSAKRDTEKKDTEKKDTEKKDSEKKDESSKTKPDSTSPDSTKPSDAKKSDDSKKPGDASKPDVSPTGAVAKPTADAPVVIDVFEGGEPLTRAAIAAKVRETADVELREEHLHPVTNRQILQRMLRNLLSLAQDAKDREAMLGYLEALVALDTDNPQDRGLRAIVKFETGRRDAAITELDWFFDKQPEGLDLDRIRQMQEYFRRSPPPK